MFDFYFCSRRELAKNEKFILKLIKLLVVIQSKDRGHQQFLFHRPYDVEFCRFLLIIRQFNIELTWELNKAERDPKLKNLFGNLSVNFRKNMNKVSIH